MTEKNETSPQDGNLWTHLCVFLISMTIVVGACFVFLYGTAWPGFVRFVFGLCAFVTVCVCWNAAKKLSKRGTYSEE